MRHVFVLALAMVFGSAVFAKGKFKVPEDAVIKVYSKDGKLLGKMTRKQYKVVKIEKKKKPVKVKVVKVKDTKQRVSVLLGMGSSYGDLSVKKINNVWKVDNRRINVLKAGLCTLKEGAGLCGEVSSDGSFGAHVVIPVGSFK